MAVMDHTTPRISRPTPVRPIPPKRALTTPTKTTFTSDWTYGMAIETKSDYLRELLNQKRGWGATSPRRPSTSGGTNKSAHDGRYSALEQGRQTPPMSANSATRPKRSASVNNHHHPRLPTRALTSRETDELIDKMSKDAFDLKLRITLQDERIKKLNAQLDEALEKAKQYDRLEEKYERAREDKEMIVKRVKLLEETHSKLRGDNEELNEINEELVKELEQRDIAVQEAAEIINELQSKADTLQLASSQTALMNSNHDSDYFSAEQESPQMKPLKLHKPVPNNILNTPASTRPSTSATVIPDSDYFSASDASPYPSPRTPRQLSKRIQNPANSGKPSRRPILIASPVPQHAPLRHFDSLDPVNHYIQSGITQPLSQAPPVLPRAPRPLARRNKTPAPLKSSTSRPLRDLYRASADPEQAPLPLNHTPPQVEASMSPGLQLARDATRDTIDVQADALSKQGPESSWPRWPTRRSQSQSESPTDSLDETAGKLPSEVSSFAPWGEKSVHRYPPWPPSFGLSHRDGGDVFGGEGYFGFEERKGG
ncbi:hypothetical protein LTS18_014199 [Coniosporium uncinatum]|uniref:Uncharacterized protein n=1 Tax=Coniosporium uncinatum TaxID=93489 RepID=A0ACC3DYQ9_9PEZI|nr:hypothetical protein LTS18_014199 [Coniosporium uncinatum]